MFWIRRSNMTKCFVSALFIAGALMCSTVGGRAAGDGSQPEALPNVNQTTSDQCKEQYGALKKDLEAAAQPIREVKQRRGPAAALCGLITAYGEAEIKIIEFVDANSTRCGFSRNFGDDARKAHVTTERLAAEACKKPQVPWRE
jgi:hypothetical protein